MRAIPALPVQDIATATAFYHARLGFTAGYQDTTFAILTRDDVELHLWAASDAAWRLRPTTMASQPVMSGAETFLAGTGSCRIEVRQIESLYAEYWQSRVLYDSRTVIQLQPWGTREFAALDLERNLLTFFERE